MLLAALSRWCGRPCGLQALDATGQPLWQEGPVPEAGAAGVAIERLGVRVGVLHVPGAPDITAMAVALEPALPALAALLHRAAEPDDAGPRGAHAELVRAALAGADTFVWEWHIDNDWLTDIGEGLAQLGFEAAEVGHTQDAWDTLIHPEDREANEQAYQRHARGELDVYEHAYRARHKDGRWLWMQERGRVIERQADGRPRRMVGTQTDITERRAAEAAASLATARLERLAQHVPGLLFQFEQAPGEPGHFLYVSERGSDLFGLTVAQALQGVQAVFETIELEDRRRMRQQMRDSAATGAEWHCDFRVRRADGEQRWMQGTATPEREADGRTVWHGYVEDITERRQLEQARQDAAVADAANRAKTEFLSRMSHELRTPLNAVLGFAQLMEIDHVEPPGPGQQRRLKLIREAGEHLLYMIGDMLDLTRIESGGMALQIEGVPLRVLAARTLEMLRAMADKAQVRLVLVDGVEGAEVVARADRTRLRQVLLNLLGNAIKYNRPGGRVELCLQGGDDGQALITISDTGVGIAPADLPRVFEPFQRGRQAGGAVEGAGIGLAVTRALVELMAGRIEASSVPGAGSVFSVRLPLAQPLHSST